MDSGKITSTGFQGLKLLKTLIHQPKFYAWHKMFDGIFYIKDTYRCTENL